MKIESKYSLKDNVYIEYCGRIILARIYGIAINHYVCIIEQEDISNDNNEIVFEIVYTFYINQRDSSGKRRVVTYKENQVFSSKEELLLNIPLEEEL
jgi:hypothetical protein